MQIKLTIKELNVFYAIVKCKTVQAAADELNITQSAASQALSKLEKTLNVTLFDRNGRLLILNENGRLILPHTIQLLDLAKNIEETFLEQQVSIKVGASTTIANYLMPNYLANFRMHYPKTKLDMIVGNTEAIIRAVSNFDVDIGFIEGECHHSDIKITKWQDDELVVFSAPNYLPNQTPLSFEELRLLPWLLREKGSGTRDKVEQFLHTYLGEFHIDMELGNSEAIKYAVAAGLGISCLSRHVVNDLLKEDRIQLLNSQLPVLKRQFYIITHRNKQQTQGMLSFLNTLSFL